MELPQPDWLTLSANVRHRIQPLFFEGQAHIPQESIPLKRFQLSGKIIYYFIYNLITFVQTFDIYYIFVFICINI